jgi:hypothetical protein
MAATTKEVCEVLNMMEQEFMMSMQQYAQNPQMA